MYKITENYFKYQKDRYISIIVFMILPGVLSASLLVNSAIVIIFFMSLIFVNVIVIAAKVIKILNIYMIKPFFYKILNV